MTDEPRRMADGTGGGPTGGDTSDVPFDAVTPIEFGEIVRLDHALARMERGETDGLDPRDDAELTALVHTSATLRRSFQESAETQSFQSFHHRSRAAILHTLEAEQPVPFRERLRVIVAAAAGLAAIAISVTAVGAPLLDRGADEGAVVTLPNLTVRSSEDQLRAVSSSVQVIQSRAQGGGSVSTQMLHAFTENAARLADAIEREPETVSPDMVRAFAEQAEAVQSALDTAEPEPGAEGAALAAQRAAEDGQVVATRYLGATEPTATPTATPEATATATPEATVTATGTPTATPTASPTATETPAATPTPSVTPTASGTPEPPVLID